MQAVVQELRGEKIDIVPYNEDPARFVCNAIAPAEVTRVIIDAEGHRMELVVPDDKLSLAIGKKGQNVRLASQLSGWRIDIHSESKIQELEVRAKRQLASIEGMDAEVAETVFKLGWRSVHDIANAVTGELAGVPKIGSVEAAQAIIDGAKTFIKTEKTRQQAARKEAERRSNLSDRDRLLEVKNVTEKLADRLLESGLTVDQVYRAQDIEALARLADCDRNEARRLRHRAGVWLGDISPKTPEPADEVDVPAEPAAAAEATEGSEAEA